MDEEPKWFNDKIKAVPLRNRLYKFMCFFLFKRKGLTYKELYMIIEYLNRKTIGENSKKHAMQEIIEIYMFNNKENKK